MAKLQSGTRIYGTASTDGKLTANSVTLSGGTTTIAPLTFTSGTSLTTQTAGAMEYDGVNMYMTPESTAGRGAVAAFQQFVLTADATITATTASDFFGTNSSINLLAASNYDIECFCYFFKVTTAGTITFAPTFSAATVMISSFYQSTPLNGFTTTLGAGTPIFNNAGILTSTAATHTATGTLPLTQYQTYLFRIKVITNTACNFRLKMTQSTNGTTVKAGSYYTVRRVTGNAGNYVA